MPTRNQAAFIGSAVRSVLEQHLGLLDLRDKAWEPDNLRLLPSHVGSEVG